MARVSAALFSIVLFSTVCQAADGQPPGDQRYLESYSLGYEFGASLKRQQIEVDVEALLAAARTALAGGEPALSGDAMRAALTALRKKAIIADDQRYRRLAEQSLASGRKFLEENGRRAGVTTLPSGLQYEVLREGTGPSPKPSDMVKVHYRGTFVDGAEFDGTHGGSPAILHAGDMVRGWGEALPLMKVGATWKIFLPPALGYGNRQFGRIPPNSALIFEIALLAAGEDLAPDDAGDEGESEAPSAGTKP